MSDDITYEFVKGQGWVPKKRGPAWNVEKILEEWVKFEHQDFLFDRLDENPIDNYWFPPTAPRRLQLTIQEFERLITRRVDGYETRLSYRLQTGETLAYIVTLYPFHHALDEYNYIRMNRAIRDMYREAQRRGF